MSSRLRMGASEVQGRLLPKQLMPKGEPESKIKTAVIRALSKLPYVLVVNTPAGKFTLGGRWVHCTCKGWPDLSGLVQRVDGTAVPFFLELKAINGCLDGDQLAMRERITRLGGYVGVARSVPEAVAHAVRAHELA